jgi:hypothetical protein
VKKWRSPDAKKPCTTNPELQQISEELAWKNLKMTIAKQKQGKNVIPLVVKMLFC